MKDEARQTLSGLILIDKPSGMTSHDVVDRVRKIARTRRVGHAGTLDPMATGLLAVAVGGATRILQFLTGLTKEYEGTIRLGAISSTYDAEGEIDTQNAPLPRDADSVTDVMSRQLGARMQLPPPHSAVKVAGRRLYDYARSGEEVPIRPRPVMIHQFRLVDYSEGLITFTSRVGSGTYIRSMAHDLGIELGCGGYLASLRRTVVGHFTIAEAVTLHELIENPERIEACLLGVPEALRHLTKVTVAPISERAIYNGRPFTAADILDCETLPLEGEDILVLSQRGDALSVVRAEPVEDTAQGLLPALLFKPVRVLSHD